ncbi:MAG: NAD(+)/NADH kinase, partial [Acidimicrobiales bacterium]
MSAVALIVHHERPEAATVAKAAATWLRERGHEVRVPADDALAVGLEEFATAAPALVGGLDLAVSIGGDGTMLRTVDLVSVNGVPVLGVNVGTLGYLTEVEPGDLPTALERCLGNDYPVEKRMLLAVTTEAETETSDCAPPPAVALNEAVLEKTPMGHTVRLAVYLDGDFFHVYTADGLIVATPTGSTAYSFSAGGPIVGPEHRALLLTPVAPHGLFDRTLVLEPETRIRIEVAGPRPATLSVDGRNLGVVGEGDAIVCTAADRSARLVTFRPRDFHRILKTKFGLDGGRGDR